MRPGRLVRKMVGGENLEALAGRRYHPQLGSDALRLAPLIPQSALFPGELDRHFVFGEEISR